MPSGFGSNPTITLSGTQNVNIVNWDSLAPIPAGTAGIGKVIVTAQTGTQTVNVVVSTAVAMSGTGNVTIAGQPIGISGTVTGIVAASGTQNVSIVNTADVFAIPTGNSIRYAGTS